MRHNMQGFLFPVDFLPCCTDTASWEHRGKSFHTQVFLSLSLSCNTLNGRSHAPKKLQDCKGFSFQQISYLDFTGTAQEALKTTLLYRYGLLSWQAMRQNRLRGFFFRVDFLPGCTGTAQELKKPHLCKNYTSAKKESINPTSSWLWPIPQACGRLGS